jgi:hypothetical protein
MTVLLVQAKRPSDGPGRTLFLKCGGNDRSMRNSAPDADRPSRGHRDGLAIFALLFPHPMERLPVLLDVQAKA